MTIADLAESYGYKLQPWQAEAAARIERGEYPIISAPKRGGKRWFFGLVAEWEALMKREELATQNGGDDGNTL